MSHPASNSVALPVILLAAGGLLAACRAPARGLHQTQVPVPAGADSAWAVGVAARQLGLGAAVGAHRVLGYRAEPEGFLVRLTPGPPPAGTVRLGGGGSVWVGRGGAVVVLAVYQ
jgi:hypothetical protein